MTEVYLNSKFIGEADNPETFVQQFRDERRKGNIDINANIYYNSDENSIHIQSGKGRARRPLIIVKEGKPLLTEKHIKQLEKKEISWSDLITEGLIEYLDASEEENALVAFFEDELTPEHTHLEITPLALLGLTTSLVPYGNFNQSTRLNAGSKNQKQALGFYAANFYTRMDMDVSILIILKFL